MNKEQLQDWLKGFWDGAVAFVAWAAEHLTLLAIICVGGLFGLALLIFVIVRTARYIRSRRSAKKQERLQQEWAE
jgi:hypothetical protein